jgi:hypothetical protein
MSHVYSAATIEDTGRTNDSSPEPAEPIGEELEAEVEELKQELAERSSGASVRVRGVTAIVLVLLTAIAITASGAAWWVHYVALDTEALMNLMGPAITSDEFTTALGDRLAEDAVTALDLEARFETRLSALDDYIGEQLVEAIDPDPRVLDLIKGLDIPRFADLAGPIATAANDRITTAITTLASSDEFRDALLATTRKAHETLVALVTNLDALPNLYVDGDSVKWNVLPLVANTLEYVLRQGILGGQDITLPDLSDNPVASVAIGRLADALGSRLPDDLGQITVMSTGQLNAIQDYGDAFDRSVWLLIGLAFALVVVTIAVSPRKRRTLVQLSIATVIALIIVAIGIRTAISSIQDGIVLEVNRVAALRVLFDLQDSAQAVGVTIFLIAILVGGLAWLGGRPRQVEKWLDAGRNAVDRTREPTKVDVFVGRWFDGLAVLVVMFALWLTWQTGLSWWWTPLTLLVVGGFVWYGMSARARYELDQAVEEVLEEAAEEAVERSETT